MILDHYSVEIPDNKSISSIASKVEEGATER